MNGIQNGLLVCRRMYDEGMIAVTGCKIKMKWFDVAKLKSMVAENQRRGWMRYPCQAFAQSDCHPTLSCKAPRIWKEEQLT